MRVAKALIQDGNASGILLEDGQEIRCGRLVSSADPRTTFFDLVGASELEVRFVREARAVRYEGHIARLLLTLDGLPAFPSLKTSEALGAHLLDCPNLEAFEHAADAAKFGRLPEKPVLDLRIASALDPAVAPPGMHLATVDILHVPYRLAQGNWDEARQELTQIVLSQLEQHAPGLGNHVVESRLLTPLDYEQVYGLPEGDPYHGQMGLDQLLFMRPVPAAARYRTPIGGLYLCGSGSHPGGGLTGAPGYNAAREILKDRDRQRQIS
jgi:phytoene dehydrogenase-like protein